MPFIPRSTKLESDLFSGGISPIGLTGGIAAGAIIYPILTSKLGMTKENAYVNAISLSYMLARYYLGNLNDIKPAAVIAGIPLGSVTELSHGISDREVRYRANGGVFLAHQHGGNESLRIIGRAWGPNRFIFLNMLDFLFLYGSERVEDVLAQTTQSEFWDQQPIVYEYGQPMSGSNLGFDPWQEVKLENISEGYKEQHMTFPVITKDRVYLSMFIETYSWRQRLDEEGRKMVEYTIFFRKYEPVEEYDFGQVQKPPINDGDAPEYINVYRERTKKENPRVYAEYKSSIEILTSLLVNFGLLLNVSSILDFGQQFMMNYFGSKRVEGRIPSIIEQSFF